MEWMEYYAKKQSGIIFEVETVKRLINHEIELLNEKLREVDLNIVADGNHLVFPNCIIEYKVSKDSLTFTRLNKNNPSSIELGFAVLLSGGCYSYSVKGKKYTFEKLDVNAIDSLFQCLVLS